MGEPKLTNEEKFKLIIDLIDQISKGRFHQTTDVPFKDDYISKIIYALKDLRWSIDARINEVRYKYCVIIEAANKQWRDLERITHDRLDAQLKQYYKNGEYLIGRTDRVSLLTKHFFCDKSRLN